MGSELNLLSNLLKKGATKSKNIYSGFTVGRKIKNLQQAEKGLEAAKQGGLALAKYRGGRGLKAVGTIGNIYAAGATAHATYKAYKHGGPEEAAKTALREAATFASYILPARIPYVGLPVTVGMLATDFYRGSQGKDSLLNTALDKYLPGLKPKEYEETEEVEDNGDRAVVESSPYMSAGPAAEAGMSPYSNYPSEREVKKMQRRQMFRELARQEGTRDLDEHEAKMYGNY